MAGTMTEIPENGGAPPWRNPCEEEGCPLQGTFWDDDGRLWLVYLCPDGLKPYLANPEPDPEG